MTRRELRELALEYAASVLNSSMDGCDPPEQVAERDEGVFWEEVAAVGGSLEKRLRRYKETERGNI